MPRAHRSVVKKKRHKKWIKRAKGYRGRRSQVFKIAKEAVLKAGQHAYRDRRKKKSTFRAQWQTHINAAVRQYDMSYSVFMGKLQKNKIELNRKVLSELAKEKKEIFEEIVNKVKTK